MYNYAKKDLDKLNKTYDDTLYELKKQYNGYHFAKKSEGITARTILSSKSSRMSSSTLKKLFRIK